MNEEQLNVLLKEIGAETMPPEEQGKLLEMIASRMQQVMLTTLVELMTNEQKTALTEALKDEEKMDERIAELIAEVPNAEIMVNMAMERELGVIKEILQKK
jgi:hypothetical protein